MLDGENREEMRWDSWTPSYLTEETLGEMTSKPELIEGARLGQVFWIDLYLDVPLLRTNEHT